ncbi:MAG: hypothetical protein WD751_08865 [Anaerolineales bacterium]
MGLDAEKKQGQETPALDRAGEPPKRERNWEVWKTIEAGGRSVQALTRDLEQTGIYFHKYALKMTRSADFVTLSTQEQISLVRLKVSDLGFGPLPPTLDQIYQKARELGLDLCPPEVGLELRLKFDGRPGERLYVGMKQIDLPDEEDLHQLQPHVFALERDKYNGKKDGIKLIGTVLTSSLHRDLGDEFVFRLRK